MTAGLSNETAVEGNLSPATSPGKRKMINFMSEVELKDGVKSSAPSETCLSHSVSVTDIDHLSTTTKPKGREAFSSQIPCNAVNLCSASFGARVLFATDEWFAKADNLLKDSAPEFDVDAYCEQGKVMDGWESRRRREAGHDWCLVQLGIPYWTSAAPLSSSSPATKLQLLGIELDTAHFTGNHAPQVSIEIATLKVQNPISVVERLPHGTQRLLSGGRQGTGHTPCEVEQAKIAIADLGFSEILTRTPLQPGVEATRYHYFSYNKEADEPLILSANGKTPTWVKLNYYPDGGVARMRFWAIEVPEPKDERASKKARTIESKASQSLSFYMPIMTGPICTVVPHGRTEVLPSQLAASKKWVEISSNENGGKGVACSNKHYGEPWRLVQSTLGKGMWDGWETARHSRRPSVVRPDPTTKLMDTPLNDWCVLKLGKSPSNSGIQAIILDTNHFLGNYPESVLLEGCCCHEGEDETFWKSDASDSVKWFPLVSRTRISPNAEHVFETRQNQVLNAKESVTHARLTIFPDGGVCRVRVYT